MFTKGPGPFLTLRPNISLEEQYKSSSVVAQDFFVGSSFLVSHYFFLLLVGPPRRFPQVTEELCTWFEFNRVFLSVLFLAFKTDTALGLCQGAEKDVTRCDCLLIYLSWPIGQQSTNGHWCKERDDKSQDLLAGQNCVTHTLNFWLEIRHLISLYLSTICKMDVRTLLKQELL